MVQVRQDTKVDQDGSNGYGNNWTDSRNFCEGEMTGVAGRLDIKVKTKKSSFML